MKLKFGTKTILENINLSFDKKKLHCFLGQNGAGKSSLLKVLSGQIMGYEGMVLVENQNIQNFSVDELSHLRVIMNQSYDVAFNFTVAEVIKMGFYGIKFQTEYFQKACELVCVLPLLKESYNNLSGGEKQRVHLARAIARLYTCSAKVLFLDEPASSADIKQEMNMMQIARNIIDDGVCVIMVSHNINLTLKYADTVTMIKNGKVFNRCDTSSCNMELVAECFDIEQNLLHL